MCFESPRTRETLARAAVELPGESSKGTIRARHFGYGVFSDPSSTVTCDDSVPPFPWASAMSAFST